MAGAVPPLVSGVDASWPGVLTVQLHNPGPVSLVSCAIHVDNPVAGTQHLDWSSIDELPPNDFRSARIETSDLLPLPAPGQQVGYDLWITASGVADGVELRAPALVYSFVLGSDGNATLLP